MEVEIRAGRSTVEHFCEWTYHSYSESPLKIESNVFSDTLRRYVILKINYFCEVCFAERIITKEIEK